MAETSLTLGYWGISGIVQPARYIFEYFKVPYTDKKYAERAEWFDTDKPALKTPFPNLPYIKDGDVVITESIAVVQYAALKAHADLRGKTDLDKVYISQVYGVVNDLKEKLLPLAFNPEFEKVKGEKLKEADALLAKLSARLGDQDYMIGYLTYVDFVCYYYLDVVHRMNAATVEAHPNLMKYIQRFDNHENIKAFKASDRYTKAVLPPSAAWTGVSK